MIGRVYPKGNGFKGLLSYLETGKDGAQKRAERVAWVEFRNLPTRDLEVAACMMRATADASVSGTCEPVYHFSLSCAPGDPVDTAALRRIADRTIRDLGLEEYEVVVVAHRDRVHAHLHFAVNRVHPERGTLWSNWRDYYRIERSLRAQEREMGLAVVPGWLEPVHVRDVAARGVGVSDPDKRVLPRSGPERGARAFMDDVRDRAAPVLASARSWAEAERGLAGHGLSLVVKGGGFRIRDGQRDVKASDVGREFSRFHLEKRFGPYPDYRARLAVAERTPRLVEPRLKPAEPRNAAIVPVAAPVRPHPRAEQQELPFPEAPAAPAPVRERSRPAPARPQPPTETPAGRAPHAAKPVRVEPPPVAPPAPPAAPLLPDWLRELAQLGAAMQEAERRVDEAGKAVYAAEHALAMLTERSRRAAAARNSAAERLREVYADPKAALKAITAYRQQRSERLMLETVRSFPEQFGPLCEERVGFFRRRVTGKARSMAAVLSAVLEHYYATAAQASSPEEHAAAVRRPTDARREMYAAQLARRALPTGHSTNYQRELAQVLGSMGAEVPGGAARLARLITTTVPSAARFVADALDAAEKEERRRERERSPRGFGIDI